MPWRANSTADREAVERHAAFGIGKFSDPVYSTGDWPQALKDVLPPSILPRFTKKEQEDILGTTEFSSFMHCHEARINYRHCRFLRH